MSMQAQRRIEGKTMSELKIPPSPQPTIGARKRRQLEANEMIATLAELFPGA
jgi:hypothetical protein